MPEAAAAGAPTDEALSVMEHVHARALDLTPKETYVPLRSAPAAPGATAAPYVHEARVNLAQQNTVGPTRLRWVKRLVLRFSQLFTHRLVASTTALANGVEQLEASHQTELAQVRAELAAMRQDLTVRLDQGLLPQVVSLELQVNEALDGLAHEVKRVAESVHGVLEAQRSAQDQHALLEEQHATQEKRAASLDEASNTLARRLDALEDTTAYDRTELHRLRASLSQLARRSAYSGPVAATSSETPGLSAIEEQVYVDFELRFRGSRDEVMARQRDALPFVVELAGSSYPLVDLGCGRGEWLELLKEAGVRAYGVDSNAEMVTEVQARGLEGVVGDAIAHLEGLVPSSVQAVSGFHIAEHLSLADLGRLVDAALLALRPGGLLLLETPNPTNLAVGAAAFYLDPTHVRPLHPDFLAFLLESRGFSDVETHFVHPLRDDAPLPAADGSASAGERLLAAGHWALFGPQDFIVAARRHEVPV